MRSGDPERLERLTDDLSPQLLNYFIRRVDPPEDAADLLSETLLVMCRRPGAIPADADEARLWAYGIARRVLSTHRRGTRRRSALVERLRNDVHAGAIGRRADADYCRVHEALATLDALDQEIIRLVHWDGFSQVDVAKLLNRRAGTIRSRYARARWALRNALSDLDAKTSGLTR